MSYVSDDHRLPRRSPGATSTATAQRSLFCPSISNSQSNPQFAMSCATCRYFGSPRGLVSSIKGEVKKKHISLGWNFSCFSAHLIERDLF